MISILFLAAEPTDTARLRLGEEVREIQEKLQLAKARDNFALHQRFSVRPVDISQALLDLNPQIVHFSGHGTASGEICVEDQLGKMHVVQPEALAALFEQFTNQVNCILLNACYSEIQAQVISEHIEYVIGMNKAVGDKAAITFSVGFYQALGAGRSIEESYKLGCVQIRLQGIPEHLTPVLLNKKTQSSRKDEEIEQELRILRKRLQASVVQCHLPKLNEILGIVRSLKTQCEANDGLLAEITLFEDEVLNERRFVRDQLGIATTPLNMGDYRTVYKYARQFLEMGAPVVIDGRFGEEVSVVDYMVMARNLFIQGLKAKSLERVSEAEGLWENSPQEALKLLNETLSFLNDEILTLNDKAYLKSQVDMVQQKIVDIQTKLGINRPKRAG